VIPANHRSGSTSFRPGAATLLAALLASAAAGANDAIDEIVVTSKRHAEAAFEHVGNIATLSEEAVRQSQHVHAHELFVKVPGVWIVRGSGQESLPSVRSPVLTGPGSCGAFLVLENGIPTRPNGFCNVNQLFELPTELAAGVEVIRGPGNALYGSNALHGTINVLLPGVDSPTSAALEFGPHDFLRFSGQIASAKLGGTSAGLIHADDGGFREDSGYRQTKGYFTQSLDTGSGSLEINLAASDLDQQTAGYIPGFDAYKDPVLRRQNLNPEAYRQARSQRLTAHWQRPGSGFDLDVRPFLRHSEMEFLQHFLPGKPLEENGHTSAGVLTSLAFESGRFATVAGLDLEWADVYLRQTQFGETEGSDFLRETRPEGKHYDYRVQSAGAAAFAQTEFPVSERLALSAGLRVEHVKYDYDNRMLDGNTRDDGTPCGFGGCLYTRPGDRSDTFSNIAPKLGGRLKLGKAMVAYANAARGFRAPQMTELYRLQSGQLVSDLKSESIDSLEAGVRTVRDDWEFDASFFVMRKKDSVYRDANGYNVSGGRSRHRGVEIAWDWQLHESWRFSVDGTYALHQYDFDAVAARGETFASGNDVDSAPRWLGSAGLNFDAGGRVAADLQWVAVGPYYLDAENRHSYPGHGLLNLRARIELADEVSLAVRLNNVTDRLVADRADFAFGTYRYFPGRRREVFVELRFADASR
jgi:outer membrane receptor protein involved in Fe transport